MYNNKLTMSTITPYHCSLNDKCCIKFDRKVIRYRVFDIKGPILLEVDKWLCTTHNKYFTSLEFYKSIEDKLVIPCIGDNYGIVIFDRTIITLTLFKYIINLYLEIFNYTQISRILSTQWTTRLQDLFNIQHFNSNVSFINIEDFNKLQEHCSITNKFIEKVVTFWWYKFGLPRLSAQLNLLCKTSGEIFKNRSYLLCNIFNWIIN